MPSRYTRRSLIATLATGFAAGCVQNAADDEGEISNDEEPSTAAPTIAETSIKPEPGSCLAGEAEAYVGGSVENDVITLSGAITAPDPCYTAVLEQTDTATSRLEVWIDVESVEVGDGGVDCMQCVGIVPYEADITVETLQHVERVGVYHGDKTYELRIDDDALEAVE